jgi:hypothetical protein
VKLREHLWRPSEAFALAWLMFGVGTLFGFAVGEGLRRCVSFFAALLF